MEDQTLTSSSNHLEQAPPPKPPPKRFIKNQIPQSILNDPPSTPPYPFSPPTTTSRSTIPRRPPHVLPPISDILRSFASVDDVLVLADPTYGACCLDDLAASALGADLLIHYGHSCLVPVDVSAVPTLYVFVEIRADPSHLVSTVRSNLDPETTRRIALAGTVQFAKTIAAAKPLLVESGYEVLVPQSKPLSAGEVLGCTAPTIGRSKLIDAVVFVADGRFHLEAFMIANPSIKAYRYDPYLGRLFLESYDHEGMKEVRKCAILKARKASNWGVVFGTLGRQGNAGILGRLTARMEERGIDPMVVMMSEISPTRMELFGDSVDAWVQIACPRLSIDWGDAFEKPMLTPFEAEIALGFIKGWWEKEMMPSCMDMIKEGEGCGKDSCNCSCGRVDGETDYPMDYYAQDGGEWNSAYARKSASVQRRPRLRAR
ncbi:hypothetical protein QJS10_CPB18g01906 [Acorus calamus]|uniref:2-(3-amino-3-carboxypropyl)histidine synthase subunit 1 n=1 Tax=Acorus calamus TaxID=4465 RepID=A0AAV9CMI9_ACOCL|nr:hypothetical protein QJS10_CPB18g01906 [Acorus calamus]